jgi:hypothetical protein
VWDSTEVWKKFNLDNLESDSVNKYRLAILPSYDCERRVFTLVMDPKTPYVLINYYNKMVNDTFTDTLCRNEKIIVDIAGIENFEAIIERNCFWTMKSSEEQRLDGVAWLVEGFVTDQNPCTKKQLHVVWRKSEDSAFIEICNELLKLSGTKYSDQKEINRKCWMRE